MPTTAFNCTVSELSAIVWNQIQFKMSFITIADADSELNGCKNLLSVLFFWKKKFIEKKGEMKFVQKYELRNERRFYLILFCFFFFFQSDRYYYDDANQRGKRCDIHVASNFLRLCSHSRIKLDFFAFSYYKLSRI